MNPRKLRTLRKLDRLIPEGRGIALDAVSWELAREDVDTAIGFKQGAIDLLLHLGHEFGDLTSQLEQIPTVKPGDPVAFQLAVTETGA